MLLFASANRDHAAGRLAAAQTGYHRLLELQPDHLAAHNNLANVLIDRGCVTGAQEHARRALELAEREPALATAVRDTVQRAGQMSVGPANAAADCD